MTTPKTTLKLMSSMALRSVLNEVIPDFEKQAGIAVEIKYGATAKLSERIRGGARGEHPRHCHLKLRGGGLAAVGQHAPHLRAEVVGAHEDGVHAGQRVDGGRVCEPLR